MMNVQNACVPLKHREENDAVLIDCIEHARDQRWTARSLPIEG